MTRLIFTIFALFFLSTTSVSAGPDAGFQEGVAYLPIVPAQATAGDGTVEVVDVFWYGCPHCHKFLPFLEKWLKTKPDNVTYTRLPAVLSKNWAIHAKAYYTAEALGIADKIHRPLFEAMHTQRRKLNSEQALMEFFAEYGVNGDEFKNIFNSFAVNTKVRRATEMTRRYAISGTPTIVVNGKYQVGPKQANGDFDTLIKIMDNLIAKESAKSL